MNILIFSWRDPKHPLAGGAEQVMHEHMKGWIAAGHKVTLFSSHFENGPFSEELDNVSIIRRGHQYHLGVQLAGFIYYLKHRNDYDLLVDQFHGMPFFTPLYSQKPKVAVLQEVAREVWFLNHFPRPLNLIYGTLGYLLEPFVMKLYKNTPFITGSQSAKDDLIDYGILSKNINIIPHGVIVHRPKPFPSKEKKKTIIFLGSLAQDKGIEDAINTFNLLNKSGIYKFWIIGKGDEKYTAYLKKLVKKLGINAKIYFWGFVSIEKKFELLAKAHVLINPSVREGWGLVNIEANSMGTPVIAYNSPGLIDSVKDGESGLICGQNSPESMAEEVEKLLGDNDLFAKLQTGAKRWADRFDWVKSRNLSLRIIESIK